MRGFFKEGKLDKVLVDGNAETIYFNRDSGKVTQMQRSISGRIRVNFKESKAIAITFMNKAEHRYGPLGAFKDEEKLLKNFIWKPKDRPQSKEDIIPSLRPKPKKHKPVPGSKKTTPAAKPTTGSIVVSKSTPPVVGKVDTITKK